MPGQFDNKLKSFFINDLNNRVTCNRPNCPACIVLDT